MATHELAHMWWYMEQHSQMQSEVYNNCLVKSYYKKTNNEHRMAEKRRPIMNSLAFNTPLPPVNDVKTLLKLEENYKVSLRFVTARSPVHNTQMQL